MIESLTLINFQAHQQLQIDLDPYLTVLTGPSDVGKSSVIRALRWLTINKPDGNAFVRNGADAATVKVVIDGRRIKRTKGDGVNTYKLDGETFKAFGTNIPEPVAKLLSVGEINFQGQHDAPFWFAESAGFVSKQLNSIINLGSIDTALASINSQLRENSTAISISGVRLEEARIKRNELAIAAQIDDDLRDLEVKNSQIATRRTSATLLRSLLKSVGTYRVSAKNAGKAGLAAAPVLALAEAWVALGRQTAALRKLVSEATRCRNVIAIEKGRAEEAEERLHDLIGERCPLCNQPIKK